MAAALLPSLRRKTADLLAAAVGVKLNVLSIFVGDDEICIYHEDLENGLTEAVPNRDKFKCVTSCCVSRDVRVMDVLDPP